jgi:hypothetical protein
MYRTRQATNEDEAAMTSENDPKGLRPRAFAKRFGFGERSVYKALRSGELPHILINGRYVVLVEQAENMWKERSGERIDQD